MCEYLHAQAACMLFIDTIYNHFPQHKPQHSNAYAYLNDTQASTTPGATVPSPQPHDIRPDSTVLDLLPDQDQAPDQGEADFHPADDGAHHEEEEEDEGEEMEDANEGDEGEDEGKKHKACDILNKSLPDVPC